MMWTVGLLERLWTVGEGGKVGCECVRWVGLLRLVGL